MHGNFIACQTCHTQAAAEEYVWLDVERAAPASELPQKTPLMSVQLVAMKAGQPVYQKQSDEAFKSLLGGGVPADEALSDKLCREQFRKDVDRAISCESCHTSSGGILDWNRLGYSDERVLKLSTLSTPSIFQKYDEFYIPSF